MKEITVNKNDASQRLDKFISKYMPSLPKGMLYKGLRKNCVRVNGRHIKNGDFILSDGDRLTLYFKDEFFENGKTDKAVHSAIEPDIVYEDENLILVNKPAGLLVHSDDKCAESETLIGAIRAYLFKNGEYDPEHENSFAPSLCNRLDRNTQGLTVAAKNAAALRFINEKIRLREIHKFYLCEAEGHFQKPGGVITSNLTRHEKRVSISAAPSDNSKIIKTAYRVIAESPNSTLAEIELLTGRTHQIRAQLSALGNPLKGDVKYGSKSGGGKYFLCAYKLIFGFECTGTPFDYLSGRVFHIHSDFAKNFLSQNS